MNQSGNSFLSGSSRISQLTREIRALADNIKFELTRDPSQSMILSSSRNALGTQGIGSEYSSRTPYDHQVPHNVASILQEFSKKSHLPSANPQTESHKELSSRVSRTSHGLDDPHRFPRSSYTPETSKTTLPQTTKTFSPQKENSIAQGLLELHSKVDEVMGKSPTKTYSPPKQDRLATSLSASNVISKGLLSPPTIGYNLTSPPPENAHKYEEIKRSQNSSQRNSLSPESSKRNKTVTFLDQKNTTPSIRDFNTTPSGEGKKHLYDQDKLNLILQNIKTRKIAS